MSVGPHCWDASEPCVACGVTVQRDQDPGLGCGAAVGAARIMAVYTVLGESALDRPQITSALHAHGHGRQSQMPQRPVIETRSLIASARQNDVGEGAFHEKWLNALIVNNLMILQRRAGG